MKKLTILALILGTVGFGYIYVSNHFFRLLRLRRSKRLGMR